MSNNVGDKQDDDYLPGSRLLVSNSIGTATIRYPVLKCDQFNATTLNVSRAIYFPEMIFGKCASLTGGPITVTTNTTLVTLTSTQSIGSGWIYVYKDDYSATILSPFFVQDTTPGIYFSDTTSTTKNSLQQATGTAITLSGSRTGTPTSLIRASVTGTMTNVYYRVFFVSSYISAT